VTEGTASESPRPLSELTEAVQLPASDRLEVRRKRIEHDLSTGAPCRPEGNRAAPTRWSWPDLLFGHPRDDTAIVLEIRGAGTVALDLTRWHQDADHADHTVLARAKSPVLDIGCGPGRLVRALLAQGRHALGVDSSAAAVAAARRTGAAAVHTSVFGTVPSAGSWGSALLLDGNIGIGGDAPALLRRVGDLIAPGGLVLIEVESPSTSSEDVDVRVNYGGGIGPWFPWATVAAPDVKAIARSAGLVMSDMWQHSGRWFAELEQGSAVGEEVAS
jgi:SAM-dependent methyltransferase